MLVAHLSDIHLGRRQYGLEARMRDYEEAFVRAVDKIIELHEERGVDLVVISGDLFDNPRPSPSTYLAAIRGLTRLIEVGMDVVSIRGNHDASVVNPVDNPIAVLHSSGLVKYLDYEAVDYGGVRLIGLGCIPGSGYTRLVGELRRLMGSGFNIVLMHQYIEGAPYRYPMPNIDYYSIPSQYLPEDAYYAMGHIHEHGLRHPRLNATYPGSLEIWDSQEFETYTIEGGNVRLIKGQDPKGFLLLDVGSNGVKVSGIELPTARRMVRIIVNINGETPSTFRDLISALQGMNLKDSYVEVDVNGVMAEGYSVRDYELGAIRRLIKDALKVNVKASLVKRSGGAAPRIYGLVELIQETLRRGVGDDKLVNMVVRALDLVSEGRVDEAKALVEKALGLGGFEWFQ